MSAFQIAQPRPRDHVAGSTPSAERNAARLAPENSVQAITTSHAGSPTAAQPKSITAASRPSRSSRLPAATSPWTQTGAPSQGAPSASSNTRRTASRDRTAESLERPRRLLRVRRQRPAAEEVVRPRRRAAGGGSALQRAEERRERRR